MASSSQFTKYDWRKWASDWYPWQFALISTTSATHPPEEKEVLK